MISEDEGTDKPLHGYLVIGVAGVFIAAAIALVAALKIR